jgi:hypothetical protein
MEVGHRSDKADPLRMVFESIVESRPICVKTGLGSQRAKLGLKISLGFRNRQEVLVRENLGGGHRHQLDETEEESLFTSESHEVAESLFVLAADQDAIETDLSEPRAFAGFEASEPANARGSPKSVSIAS